MPKISFIVPVYNTGLYIKKCLDSIINQTFKEKIEIILINDGSTDNSGKIIDEYCVRNSNFYSIDSFLRYILNITDRDNPEVGTDYEIWNGTGISGVELDNEYHLILTFDDGNKNNFNVSVLFFFIFLSPPKLG